MLTIRHLPLRAPKCPANPVPGGWYRREGGRGRMGGREANAGRLGVLLLCKPCHVGFVILDGMFATERVPAAAARAAMGTDDAC